VITEAEEAAYDLLHSLLKGMHSDVLPDETTVKELMNQPQRGEEPTLL
jgi:hypothetical protein